MLSRVASFQGCGFTQAKISTVIEQHPKFLASTAENTQDLLVVIELDRRLDMIALQLAATLPQAKCWDLAGSTCST
ncbi:hypothetical protein WJX77_002285 [Trebouxia sp. C0004]